jgi:hypothetical protein
MCKLYRSTGAKHEPAGKIFEGGTINNRCHLINLPPIVWGFYDRTIVGKLRMNIENIYKYLILGRIFKAAIARSLPEQTDLRAVRVMTRLMAGCLPAICKR